MNDTLNLSEIKSIILDIDDTLNSLTLTIMGDVFGCSVGPYDYDRFPTGVGYDIIKAVNQMLELEGDEQWQLKEFWNTVPRNLWASAPLSKECYYLLSRSAQLVGKENVFLASTPTKDPDAHAGKIEWINAYMPSWMHRQYFITPRKWRLANSETLLIDDCDDNIDKFCKKQGQALIVPRPWNNSNEFNTMDFLVEHLGEIV